MGTPDFAVPSLVRLAQSEHPVVAVVTRPDAQQGRGRGLAFPPVKTAASTLGLPILQPQSLMDPAFLKALPDLQASLFVVVAFPILPRQVLAIPTHGSVNLHGSLLPKYRGAAPVHRAIMAGDTETGLTTFLLKPRVDAGDVLMQRRVAIGPEESSGELIDRMKYLGADLLAETISGLASGSITPVPQPGEGASVAPKLSREDGRIDWTRDATTLHNLVRGTSPEPGAFTVWRGQFLKVHRVTRDFETLPGKCGEVVSIHPDGSPLVATGRGGIRLAEVQVPGKKRTAGADWVRGYRVQVGERLGE